MYKILIILFFFSGITSNATNYYSDPVNGKMTNAGDKNSPWESLEVIFSAGKTFLAGDTIFLLSGVHGQPFITGSHTNYVTIKVMEGHTPYIASVQIENGSYWAFDGVTFTSDGSGGTFTRDYMLTTKSNLEYLKVVNCTFYSEETSDTWSKADWYAKADDAVIVRGDNTIFNNNLIKNVYFALQIEGDYAEVKNNTIDNFGADAIRALGSFAVYDGNIIRDAYIEDYGVNHDDAIQMYDRGNINNGVIDDVKIVNNIIYTFADSITQKMIDDNLVGYSMQGIIITDGHIENSVVENNLVVSDHYHGITLMGADNCRVQNNTVMKTPTSVNPTANVMPWIQLRADKNGNECSNSTLRNNIASKLTPWTYADGTNMTTENNLEPSASAYSSYFVDYSNFDFHIKETSPAVDAGINTDITSTDLDGNIRLVGANVDCGCYEYQDGITGDVIKITSSPEDGFVSDASIVTTKNPQTSTAFLDGTEVGMKAGSSDANGNANLSSVVIPFRLPEIPAGKKLVSASLKVYVNFGREWTNTNLDLYGLPFRTLPAISTDDYYSGSFGLGNGTDTGIADDFISKNVALGLVDSPRWEETSGAVNTNLGNYIDAQYSAGAVAGDWVFIRFSVDNVSMTTSQFFGISDATMDNPPELSLFFDNATGITPVEMEMVEIFPNPVIDGRFRINLKDKIEGQTLLQIYTISGILVYESRLQNASNTISVDLNPDIYLVRLINGEKIYFSKLLIK